MPSWKRVVVSGSDATLNSLFVATSVTASVFSGSFTGSLFGSASYAVTASFAPDQLRAKSGVISAGSFTGNPKKATVAFSTAFTTTNYGVVITGEDARSWTIEGKLAAGFTASANSNTTLAGNTYWMASLYGETL